ncbi:signal peptidase I [Marininema halotolerans]|uniref:signal peptidase I n=1 Tax=Marininema halotolerans TaxID=1155944 RepID=UPI002481B129|nr:signal peptidase I [Marininema halotolerans]
MSLKLSRGDIILFQPPGSTQLFTKRIVGLAGDRIRARHHRLDINHHPSPLPSFSKKAIDNFPLRLVPKQHLFVMGDNPTQSIDSRHFGSVTISSVEGRVVAILQPWNQFRWFQ